MKIFHRTPKITKKPNMDGVNLLVSILVCYPEVVTVSYEPKEEALRFAFGLKCVPDKASFKKVAGYLAESVRAYQDLEGYEGASVEFYIEGQEGTSFFYVVRDVRTLSRGEINLLADIMQDFYGEKLMMGETQEPYDEEEEMMREEALDHMIGNLRTTRIGDRMVGIREEGRVLVFNR